MGRRKTLFDESLFMNDYTYRNYYFILLNLAMSRFKYKNLPFSADARTLELSLLENNSCCVFKDEVIDDIVTLPYVQKGNFDIYGNPVRIDVYSRYNDYRKSLEANEFVIVWNNLTRTNNLIDLQMFAKRLYNLDRIIDVNCNAQKTPVLIKANEKQRLTMKNLYKEYDGNSPFIFGDKNLDINDITAISTNAPFVSDRIFSLKTQIFNEALTYLGITNVSIQKKERMITDEVTRTQGGTFANRFAFLDCRVRAFDLANKKFGCDVQVEFNEDVNGMARQSLKNVMGDGDNDE